MESNYFLAFNIVLLCIIAALLIAGGIYMYVSGSGVKKLAIRVAANGEAAHKVIKDRIEVDEGKYIDLEVRVSVLEKKK
mgnify:FL=1